MASRWNMWQNSIRLQTMNLSNPPFTRHEISVVDLLQSCPRHFPGAALFGAEHVLSFVVLSLLGSLHLLTAGSRQSAVCWRPTGTPRRLGVVASKNFLPGQCFLQTPGVFAQWSRVPRVFAVPTKICRLKFGSLHFRNIRGDHKVTWWNGAIVFRSRNPTFCRAPGCFRTISL